ncbi:MAG: alpha/beta fold hydrolase [Bdellovibrionales bacterium]
MESDKNNNGVKPLCIVALHGFLATSKVWDRLKEVVDNSVHWYTPDLIQSRYLIGQAPGFTDAVRVLKSEFQGLKKDYQLWGMGYSMGGRLLAHVLVDSPSLFEKTFFLSTDPFQLSDDQFELRQKWQEDWLTKFRTLSWSDLIDEWNSQPVFSGSQALPSWVNEQEIDRQLLAESFEKWSRLNQLIRIEDINQLQGVDLIWAYGEKDKKYKNLYETWRKQGLKGRFVEFKGLGHRFPFEDTVELLNRLDLPAGWEACQN